MSNFTPHREPETQRLHYTAGPCPKDTHWPPKDPHTGTPKNGTRTARPHAPVGPAVQLITPPASQNQVEPVAGPSRLREATPPSPTPAAAAPSLGSARSSRSVSPLFLAALPGGFASSSRSASPVLPTPATLIRPVYQVDGADDPFLDFAPAPAPASSATSSRAPSHAPSTRTMSSSPHPVASSSSSNQPEPPNPFSASSTPTPSSSKTVLVAQTPPVNPNSHRPRNQPDPDPFADIPLPSLEELQHLRQQRTTLTVALTSATTLTQRLRTRNTIEQGQTLAERALTQQAREDRDAVREELVGVRRREETVWRVLVVVVVLVGVYGAWCWWNRVEFEYIRKRRGVGFGM